MSRTTSLIIVLCVLGALPLGAQDIRGPLHPWPDKTGTSQPDEYTTFLAHFDKGVKKPDYALGNEAFLGTGFLSGPGYRGRGLDLSQVVLQKDYYTRSDSGLPFYAYFGIWPFANFNHYQGTLEFWFQLKNDKQGHLISVWNGLFNASVKMSPVVLDIKWPCLKKKTVRGHVKFPVPLTKNMWHYYTQTWSDGEFAIYIDGRLVFTFDMSEGKGLVRGRIDKRPFRIGADINPTKKLPLWLDELAISNVVRYKHDFEPCWKNNKRPGYAFKGLAKTLKRYPAREKEPLIPTADKPGILLWEGLERRPLPRDKASASGLDVDVRVEKKTNAAVWYVSIRNKTNKERWLEVLFSQPAPFMPTTYFDGSVAHKDLRFPRRRDENAYALPYAAVSDGKRFFGIGLDPHIWVSSLLHEWIPGQKGSAGTVRQGFRWIVDAKGMDTFRFIVLEGQAPFGFRNALQAYYYRYPDLFKVRRDVPVNVNLPIGITNISWHWKPYVWFASEMTRQAYCGHGWLFAPHYKMHGDDAATRRFWNNPKFFKRKEYAKAKKTIDEKYQGNIEAFWQDQKLRYRKAYENFYTRPMCHWDPEMPNRLIIEELYPEGLDEEGDRLQNGQYYSPHAFAFFVNTFNTPVGRHIMDQVDILSRRWGRTNLGFINDVIYNSTQKMTDPLARKAKGRAFSSYTGSYLLNVFGYAQIFRHIQSKKFASNKRLGTVADGGSSNYIIATVTDKLVVEWESLGYAYGMEERHWMGRVLAGEKPWETLSTKICRVDKSAEYLGQSFEKITEKELRNYYRYYYDQYFLVHLKYGMMVGNNQAAGGILNYRNTRALIVAGQLAGYRIVPGAWVDEPLFVVRFGHGMETYFILGNQQPTEQTSNLTIHNPSVGRGVYLYGDYYGASCLQIPGKERTVISNVAVKRRFIRAFRPFAHIQGQLPQRVRVTARGSGATFSMLFEIKCDQKTKFTFMPFVPKDYAVQKITMDNIEVEKNKPVLQLDKGEHAIIVQYQHCVLCFSEDDWQKVELIKNNQVQFQIVVPAVASDFDKGTAQWPNRFVRVYDREDNVTGNLKAHPVFEEVEPKSTIKNDFSGWKICTASLTKENAPVARVDLDLKNKKIMIDGPNEAERRRAMAVFMRLVDRKYPRIGSYLYPQEMAPFDRLAAAPDKKLAAIIKKYNFHKKPLLPDEYESLYAGNNLDFQGKYIIDYAPYIYEPAEWE